MGPVTTQFARIDPGPSQRFGLVGAGIAAIGAIVLIVAFTAINWFDGSGDSHFGDLHKLAGALDDKNLASSWSVVYFGWLSWVLLAVGFIVAILANLPSPLSAILRGLGVLIGLVGIALTFAAIKLTKSAAAAQQAGSPPNYGDYFKHVSIGFWLAVVGFLVIAIGAVIGPRRS